MQKTSNKNYPSIKHLDKESRPREKMLKSGASTLGMAELLAILIGSGNQNISALQMGYDIMDKVNRQYSELSRLTIGDLKSIHGIGETKAVQLCAAFELGRRRKEEEARKVPQIKCSNDAYLYFLPLLEDLNHEEFWILLLSRNNRVMDVKRISTGGVSGTVVDPRIIFKMAIDHLASGIILCHNHPSGNLNPSTQDIEITKKVKHGGRLLDIEIKDHLIIGTNEYFSFGDNGVL